MNLLGAKLYDPSSAATKATSSLLAMTALDTSNLRLTVTVPAHGFIFCRMRCQLEGATTFPQVLLGLLVGAAVTARVTPTATLGATALATTRVTLTAEFVVPGLTPGSTVFDAAYGVEILLASTNIKYGGPNNTTTDDAWGAFVFEIWDPQPLPTAAPAAVGGLVTAPTTANVALADVSRLLGSAWLAPGTAGTPDVNVKLWNALTTVALPLTPTVAGRTLDCSAGGEAGLDWANIGSPTTTVALSGTTVGIVTTLTNLPAITANWLTAAGTAADFGAEVAAAVWQDAVAGDFTVASSIGKALYIANVAPGAAGGHFISGSNAATTVNFTGSLSGSVGSVTGAVASVTAGVTLAASAVQAIWDALTSALTTAGSIGKKLADWTIGTAQTGDSFARLGAPTGASASADIAAAKADTAAIKVQTDKLAFTVANQIDANVIDWKSATAPAMTGDAFARLGAPVGASISADIAGVQSDTDNLQTRIPAALVGGRIDASVGAVAANAIDAAALAADAGTEIGTAVWASAARVLTAGTNIALAKGVGVTGFNDLSAAQVNAEADTALADAGVTTAVTGRIDVAVSTRLAAADYTAPDNTSIAAILVDTTEIGAAGVGLTAITDKTGNLPSDPADESLIIAATDAIMTRIGAAGAGLTALGDARLANLDAAISSRLATAEYTAPLSAAGTRSAIGLASANLDTQLAEIGGETDDIAAIKEKTDQLVFTIANQADVNLRSTNSIGIGGTGTEGDPWGPA